MATTIRAMLNTDRVSVSGFYPLVIRIIHNRRKRLIYSPYKLREADFDSEIQKAYRSEPEHYSTKQIQQINRYIESQKRILERIVITLQKKTNDLFTVNDIMAEYGCPKVYRYLFEYMDKEVQDRINTHRFGAAILYRTTKESIKRFTKGNDILLQKISHTFLNNYMNYLREEGIKENSIQMYLRNLRSIYNKACKEGLVTATDSPFEDIKTNGTATVKRTVTKEVMRKIAYADLSYSKEMERARDVFMFSFYTRGMSLVDILYLKHSDIRNGSIYYVRNKTSQIIQMNITYPLKILIDKYRTDSIYVLPYLTEDSQSSLYRQYRNALTQINKYLKKVGEILKIDTPLTTYVARHSWVMIAKSEGASIAAISEALGHSTEKATQTYLKTFDCNLIDEVNAKVILL